MENKFIPYPKEIKVGGQRVEVRDVERCNSNKAGEACACGGWIEIADKFDKDDRQSPDSKRNTFFHEMIHVILTNMGENELMATKSLYVPLPDFSPRRWLTLSL